MSVCVQINAAVFWYFPASLKIDIIKNGENIKEIRKQKITFIWFVVGVKIELCILWNAVVIVEMLARHSEEKVKAINCTWDSWLEPSFPKKKYDSYLCECGDSLALRHLTVKIVDANDDRNQFASRKHIFLFIGFGWSKKPLNLDNICVYAKLTATLRWVWHCAIEWSGLSRCVTIVFWHANHIKFKAIPENWFVDVTIFHCNVAVDHCTERLIYLNGKIFTFST